MIYYAIGDIHGRDDLLEKMYARIGADRWLRHSGEECTIVHVGDYIDGGPNSRAVLDLLMRGVDSFKSIHLLGNHEAMMLACLETDDRQVWLNWLNNGGDATLNSFGVSFRFGGYEPHMLIEVLGVERISWLNALKPYHRTDEYLFVHAGIVPGRPLAQQKTKDMLWIRGRFLRSEQDHGYVVVHGHTPTEQPVLRSNRIGIDTGAKTGGELAAVVLGSTAPRFISVTSN